MPTYEYRCPDGHTFDRFFKMSDAAAELACPECGKPATRQVSGGAGLLFKGSGFYLTDYGKNAHRKSGDAPASEPKGGASKSEGQSDTKPADGAKASGTASTSGSSPSTGASSSGSSSSGSGGSSGSSGSSGSASDKK